MQTRQWRLSEADMARWVATLLGDGRRVVAPIQDGPLRVFRPIDSAAQMSLAPGKTRWSPKEFLFPKTEALFSYAVRGEGVNIEPAPADDTEQVIFGVRSCD